MTVNGQKVIEHEKGGYIHDAEGPARLSYDGRMIFAPGNVFGPDVKELGMEVDGYAFGCMSPHYILAFKGEGKGSGRRGGGDGKNLELRFYLAGEKRSIWTLKDIGAEMGGSSLRPEQRIFFVPAANVIASVGAGNNQVHLRRFNVVEALDSAGIDYLFVSSTPPAEAVRGKIFSYKVEVMSKAGGVEFKLASGPANMTVNAKTGVVAWQVPAAFKEEEFKAIVSVKDSAGQEIFHSFTVRVEKVGAAPPPGKEPVKPQPKGTRV
jgi:hypothetical protein